MASIPSKHTSDTYTCIYSEVAAINYKWQLCDYIYKKKHIALLNKIDGKAFVFIRESIVRDITMSICRLTDPEEQKGRKGVVFKNMVLTRLMNLLEADGFAGVHGLKAKHDQILNHPAIKKVRVARNTRLGHSDANASLSNQASASPTAGFGPKDLREATDLLCDFVNKAAEVMQRNSLKFGPGGGEIGIGHAFIDALENGVKE